MNLPPFLAGRPVAEAENALQATCLTVLGAFQEEGLIGDTELEYGFEDLRVLCSLAEILRDATMRWHQKTASATDFRVLQAGFVFAFRTGLDLAAQLHLHFGDGLSLNTNLSGVLEGLNTTPVREPLTSLAPEFTEKAGNVFVSFQDRSLAIAASSKNQILLGDFFACGCLWAALAGVEAGLSRLEPAMA